MLQLKNLNKSYYEPGEIEILKNISIDISGGETCSIMGASGSGKSTLLSLLSGLDRPCSGEVVFDDIYYSKFNDSEMTSFRGKNIGIVFQSFYLMPHLTAVENCALPLEIFSQIDSKAKALELLNLVGLDHRADHFPRQLSGGEQQRVAIARALIHSPKLILADEPSGNLDEKTGAQVMDLLFEVCEKRGSTLILVTHNEKIAKRCKIKYKLSQKKLNLIHE